MPITSYYQGFGAREGAVHSVGIRTGTGMDAFSDADVQVLLYSELLTPLRGNARLTVTDGDEGVVYYRLPDDRTVIIRAEHIDDPIVTRVVDSLHLTEEE